MIGIIAFPEFRLCVGLECFQIFLKWRFRSVAGVHSEIDVTVILEQKTF
jgi:hypothetical protein